jgi:anti-sigma factor RsiW
MMEPKVHCPDWEEKLSLYVDGVLNPFDENAVEAHIARCASCRATVELWRAVGQSVRRLPRELPPPYLREAILASTTRRRRMAHRWLPNWRVLAPALGVALVLAWLTLPRPATDQTPRVTAVPLPRVETTLPLASASANSAKAELSPYTPIVVLLHSSPAFRTASPVPRWTPTTRLSHAPSAQESDTPIVVWNEPPTRFVPTGITRPSIVTEIADQSESDSNPPIPAITTANFPPSELAPVAATRDLTEWLIQLNQQLREEDRQRIAGAAKREPNRGSFFVPIVSVDLK